MEKEFFIAEEISKNLEETFGLGSKEYFSKGKNIRELEILKEEGKIIFIRKNIKKEAEKILQLFESGYKNKIMATKCIKEEDFEEDIFTFIFEKIKE